MLRAFPKFTKLLHLLHTPAYRRGLTQGIGAAIEHENAIRPLALAALVDVGSNKGQFSLLARSLFPDVTIHAFEPLKEPAACYRRLFAGQSGVTLHEMALGQQAGAADINISGRDDSSSLLPISDQQEALFPGTSSIGKRTILVERGDTVLNKVALPSPAMIKLDVQGYELAALQGMPEVLGRAEYVYAEISFTELYSGQPLADEIIAHLRQSGFRLTGIYNLTTSAEGRSVQADALFSRSNASKNS